MKLKGTCICGHQRTRHWLPEDYDIDDKKHMCAECQLVDYEGRLDLMGPKDAHHLFVTAEIPD